MRAKRDVSLHPLQDTPEWVSAERVRHCLVLLLRSVFSWDKTRLMVVPGTVEIREDAPPRLSFRHHLSFYAVDDYCRTFLRDEDERKLTPQEKRHNALVENPVRQVLMHVLVYYCHWLRGGLGADGQVLCPDIMYEALCDESPGRWTLESSIRFVRSIPVVPLRKGTWSGDELVQVFSHFTDIWRFHRWWDELKASGLISAPYLCTRLGFLAPSTWDVECYSCDGKWMTRLGEDVKREWPSRLRLERETVMSTLS